MSRGRKIAVIVLGSLLGLILVVVAGGILIVRTAWFRNVVKDKIISSVEDSTGGRAEVGSFSFDWTQLHAVIHDFVIHGNEPAGAAPLFRARTIGVYLKLFTPVKKIVDIAALNVDTPQANVIVYPNGSTNIPSPKVKSSSNKTGLETVVDLAIGHFDLNNGSVTLADRPMPLDAHGENLRARLIYDQGEPEYRGEISMAPLLVRSGANAPVDINVTLPLVLQRDRIEFQNARITTPESEVTFAGAVDNLRSPHTNARVNARIALDELKRAAGAAIPLALPGNAPRFLTANGAVSMDDDHIDVSGLRIALGRSSLEAAGPLKAPGKPAGLHFNAHLDVGQLGRMLRVSARPEGALQIGGEATMASPSDYLVKANVDAHGLSFEQNGTRISGINAATAVTADPHRIELAGLRLEALGGTFAGNAELRNMAQFQLAGRLNHFDLGRAERAFSAKPLPYEGMVSGPVEAHGDIDAPRDIVARANLTIAPGPRGIPVSGRIQASYNGRDQTVDLGRSSITLPHTRLDLSGSLGREIQVHLVSHDLRDLSPGGILPVKLNGGAATFNGTVTGKLNAPHIAGQLRMTDFTVENRSFSLLTADLTAGPSGAAVRNAALTRGSLAARFTASVGLRRFKPEPYEPLSASLSIRNADLSDILALAGQSNVPATGALAATAQINGTIGDPRGSLALDVTGGTLYQQPFDAITARVNLTQQAIDVPTLRMTAGNAQLAATAQYRHPPGNLKQGVVEAHVASNRVLLAQFGHGLGGTADVLVDARANLWTAAGKQQFQLASLNANATVQGLRKDMKNLGDFTAVAQTSGTWLNYRVNSDLFGSTTRVNGRTLLTGNHDTDASATIANLPIQDVLELAGRRDIPASGILSADAHIAGTIADPRARASVSLVKAKLDQQPIDQLQAAVNYSNQMIGIPALTMVSGASRLDASGTFQHPAGDYQQGQVSFRIGSNRIQLAQLRPLQQAKPGLAGTVEVSADGSAHLRRGNIPLVQVLNAKLAATGLSVNRRPVGDLNATAETRGNQLTWNLKSDFARADIRSDGRMSLVGDYPMSGELSFANLTYTGLESWIGPLGKRDFDASAQGRITVNGPAARANDLKGTLELSRLEAYSVFNPGGAQPRRNISLHNNGPIRAVLDRGTVTIQSAQITGPYTKVSVSGSAGITGARKLDLRAAGTIRLEVIEAFNASVFSSGAVTLNAAVTGTVSSPDVNGRLDLKDASFNEISLPNGISDASGSIVFTGRQAYLENITGKTGGGKVTLAGFVNYGGPQMQFGLEATARGVRVEYPANVGTLARADLTLAGTSSRSLLSGNVRVLEVALHSHTDIGSMLSQTAAPPQAAQAQTGLLAGMRLAVRIDTAPDLQIHTTLTRDIQAEAHLQVRGTASQPGVLGRATVTSGDLVFFGSKYTIDQGSIAFYNPQRIEPIINVDLETTVQGIDVQLNVTGPMDRMKLTYRSDPPLQFTEIVSLLATGRVPTSDPVLAARQPVAPQQSFEQMGASALLGQTVANPVSGRLQRLFGVSKLSINPQFTGASTTPQATVTLQQQVSKSMTFTYIQDVTQSNPQIIRIEWAINPIWSAVAERDIYGEFAVDVFYKKRFR